LKVLKSVTSLKPVSAVLVVNHEVRKKIEKLEKELESTKKELQEQRELLQGLTKEI